MLNNGILSPLRTEEEEELVLPQGGLLEDLLDLENEDGRCILQNGLQDSLDSDDFESSGYCAYFKHH